MIKHAAILHNGVVFQGRKRHRELIQDAKPFDISKGEQGFITSVGQFVNREQAAKIAYMCKQIKGHPKKLNSEHLY